MFFKSKSQNHVCNKNIFEEKIKKIIFIYIKNICYAYYMYGNVFICR